MQKLRPRVAKPHPLSEAPFKYVQEKPRPHLLQATPLLDAPPPPPGPTHPRAEATPTQRGGALRVNWEHWEHWEPRGLYW